MSRLLLLLSVLALAAPAAAQEGEPGAVAAGSSVGASDPCAEAGWGLPTGPTRAGLLAGDLGAGHRACGRKEVGLGFGAGLTIELDNFYGRLGGQLALDGSWVVLDRLELFAELELLRAEVLITPLASTSINLGHASMGVSYGFLRTRPLALAAHSRVVLPTAVGLYRNALPFSLDVGVAGQLRVNRHLAFHGDATFLFQAMAGKGAAAERAGAAVVLGGEIIPAPGVAIVLDAKTRLGWGGEPLDMLAGAFGLRFSDAKRFAFSVEGTVPIVGRERAAVAVELRASVRFGEIGKPSWPNWVPVTERGEAP